jgi:hypothetical protein
VQHDASFFNLQIGLVGMQTRKKFRGKNNWWTRLVTAPCTDLAALARKNNLLAHDSKTFMLGPA